MKKIITTVLLSLGLLALMSCTKKEMGIEPPVSEQKNKA